MSTARVLVVDDERGVRDMLQFELGHDGYQVDTAESGARAVEMLRKHRYDAVITDYKMPGMNGAETIAALKRMEPDLAIIVGTGYASIDATLDCMKAGALDLIEKPYDFDDLRQLLASAVNQTHLDPMAGVNRVAKAILRTPAAQVPTLIRHEVQALLRAQCAIGELHAGSLQLPDDIPSPALVGLAKRTLGSEHAFHDKSLSAVAVPVHPRPAGGPAVVLVWRPAGGALSQHEMHVLETLTSLLALATRVGQ